MTPSSLGREPDAATAENTPAPALAALPVDELEEAADAFARDVYGEPDVDGRYPADLYLYRGQDGRKYEAPPKTADRPLTLAALVAHLRGERHRFGKEPIAASFPRALVFDLDFEEPSPEARATAADEYLYWLAGFDLEGVAFESNSGVHVWLRLEANISRDEAAELAGELNEWLNSDAAPPLPDTGRPREVYPKRKRALRVPLGALDGEPRQALPAFTVDQMIKWLAEPPRATREQLSDLRAAIPNVESGAEVPAKPRKPSADRSEPPRTIVAPLPVVPIAADTSDSASLRPREGLCWSRCACKELAARKGLVAAGTRHETFFTLAHDWLSNGERDEEKFVRSLLAIPLNGHSSSSAEAILTDARNIARDVLAWHKETGRTLQTGCAHASVTHSGHPTPARMREVFAHHCTPERVALCAYRELVNPEATIFRNIVVATIWRGPQGRRGAQEKGARGLGHVPEKVYRKLVQLAQGDPERIIDTGARRLTKAIGGSAGLRSITTALQTLIEAGLVEAIDRPRGLLRLRRISDEELLVLETTRGTRAAADRDEKLIDEHYAAQRARQDAHREAWKTGGGDGI